MAFCVEIEIGDNGDVSVGVCPPELENPSKEHLQPVSSVDEALGMAQQLLSQAGQGQPGGDPKQAVLQAMGMLGGGETGGGQLPPGGGM